MADLPIPRSSTPGAAPGEGEGRLVNCYAEKLGDRYVVRRVPGLTILSTVAQSYPRGMIEVDGRVYVAFSGCVVWFASDGSSSNYAGALPGSDGVTFARNNRVTGGASTPDLVAVRESGGAYVVTPTSVTAYPDPDLPGNVNSVDFLGGYLLFTVPDGRQFATDLNTLDVNALSFATAEARSDGLVRGVVHGGIFYAMGSESIEPWVNVGNSPFPLARATSVIPVGLRTAMAIAGFEAGWDLNPFFVATDGRVHELTGYDTRPVSTPDVERFISASDASSLAALVYTFRGHAIWSLSSNVGTWEYNATTGAWHERVSVGATRWRASRSLKSNGRWLVGNILSGALLVISAAEQDELGDPLVMTVETGALQEYPVRVAVPALFVDLAQAAGNVAISWSLDGGRTWLGPAIRSMTACDRAPARVNGLGLSSHRGLRARLAVSDPVEVSFMGASVPDPSPRKP